MTVSGGAFGIFFVESNVTDSNISNLGDAFWWAIVTMTTVGYGDIYPITVEGKIIASILMVAGIAIIGVLISTLGASFIESRLNPKVKSEGKSRKDIKEKIDILEILNKEEFTALIASIEKLYIDIISKNKDNNSNLNCLNCYNNNPEESVFCNKCGVSLTN
jgi:voltage-gated potassium channel